MKHMSADHRKRASFRQNGVASAAAGFVAMALLTGSVISPIEAVSPAPASFSASQEPVPQWQWFTDDAPQDAAGRWYRLVFNHSASAGAVHVAIASDQPCSLAVNGQRVLKHATLASSDHRVTSVGFDVTALMRNGRNCVAVEVHSGMPELQTAVSVTTQIAGQHGVSADGEWKTSPQLPPVGWQQTDFNDKDWIAVTVGAQPAAGGFTVVAPAEWLPAVSVSGTPRNPFAWRDGDHVVLLGATFLEREQQFGHVEAVLAGTAGANQVTFRNLGWDGDTVFAESRGIFDAPNLGYQRMIEHVRAEEPTVVIICYGQNDALARNRSVQQFRSQLQQLLDDLSTTGASMVFMSPHELLPAVPPVPSPARFNHRLSEFTDSIHGIAADRGLPFVDLFQQFTRQLSVADQQLRENGSAELLPDPDLHPDLWAVAASRWTDNGMHFNAAGYQSAALVIRERLLSIPARRPEIRIHPAEKTVVCEGGEIRQIQWQSSADELVSFEFREKYLSPLPAIVQLPDDDVGIAHERLLIPGDPQYQELVAAVVQKNELYYHRWRPQNVTYLFGFRKHEQGNNAAEIAQFDPLISALEKEIHQLQQPVWRTVRLAADRQVTVR